MLTVQTVIYIDGIIIYIRLMIIVVGPRSRSSRIAQRLYTCTRLQVLAKALTIAQYDFKKFF